MTTASSSSDSARPGLFTRLFGTVPPDPMAPLYAAVVAEARALHWYIDGGIADTVDGRFDMVALVLSIVLLRMERDDKKTESVRLTETFIDDMDGQMRETGFGDLVVGKQVGGIMSALGGRLGAYRGGIGEEALVRNLYRGAAPSAAALAHSQSAVTTLTARIDAVPMASLLAGQLG